MSKRSFAVHTNENLMGGLACVLEHCREQVPTTACEGMDAEVRATLDAKAETQEAE